MLPLREIEGRFTGDDESRLAAELLAAASMEVGRCGVDSGRGWAQSSLMRGGGDGGQGEAGFGERNRGAAAEVGRGAGEGGSALLCSCSRKKRRRRGTRQRGG